MNNGMRTEHTMDQKIKRTLMLFLTALAVTFVNFLAGESYAQSFGGAFEGMSNSDEPIQIEADQLVVEDKKGTAVLTGNVNVVQGTTILKAGNMKVFYFSDGGGTGGPNGNIKRIEAGGKVAVRSGDQRATADSAVFDMQSQTVVMEGNVSVSQ